MIMLSKIKESVKNRFNFRNAESWLNIKKKATPSHWVQNGDLEMKIDDLYDWCVKEQSKVQSKVQNNTYQATIQISYSTFGRSRSQNTYQIAIDKEEQPQTRAKALANVDLNLNHSYAQLFDFYAMKDIQNKTGRASNTQSLSLLNLVDDSSVQGTPYNHWQAMCLLQEHDNDIIEQQKDNSGLSFSRKLKLLWRYFKLNFSDDVVISKDAACSSITFGSAVKRWFLCSLLSVLCFGFYYMSISFIGDLDLLSFIKNLIALIAAIAFIVTLIASISALFYGFHLLAHLYYYGKLSWQTYSLTHSHQRLLMIYLHEKMNKTQAQPNHLNKDDTWNYLSVLCPSKPLLKLMAIHRYFKHFSSEPVFKQNSVEELLTHPVLTTTFGNPFDHCLFHYEYEVNRWKRIDVPKETNNYSLISLLNLPFSNDEEFYHWLMDKQVNTNEIVKMMEHEYDKGIKPTIKLMPLKY